MFAVTIEHYLVLAAILFVIGAAGVMTRRNALVILMSIELMLNAANLTFLAFARMHNDLQGHVMVFFVIAVAAAEAAVGLAIVLSIFRHKRSVNVDDARALKN
ncbi:MAG TPA: NADH-quinone oxidoreductase subunit NuoK [Myxococcales bacterium]|nr:NADH-quinone oxidoreductase subunit NuoK [Myxococcales bacterium]HIN86818.1 NADH-quinone oxidoreductase subunit NuoK [Myxococcales bacterium]